MTVQVIHGDALTLPFLKESVDAFVIDPPYNLAFMGRVWDTVGGPKEFQKWCEAWAREAYRVLKPGGYLLAFGGTRTAHRMTAGIEDAGFEIRDTITWIYASGFPKSLDVSKAIDRAAGAIREVIGTKRVTRILDAETLRSDNYTVGATASGGDIEVTAPATDDARRWSGWGTALKPASEPIVVARKPLAGTVAANVLEHGTGALNIDGCRIATTPEDVAIQRARTGGAMGAANTYQVYGVKARVPAGNSLGRWPSNVVWTHSPECDPEYGCVAGCPVADLDTQSGNARSSGVYVKGSRGIDSETGHRGAAPFGVNGATAPTYGDSGGASRFFPVFFWNAKAPGHERPMVKGEGFGNQNYGGYNTPACGVCGTRYGSGVNREFTCGHSEDELVWVEQLDRADGWTSHPTVKPVDLMRWLVRLVTPPGGVCLDAFAGSGTTGEALILEGMNGVLIEKDASYIPLIRARLAPYRDPVTLARARGQGVRPKRGRKKSPEGDGLF